MNLLFKRTFIIFLLALVAGGIIYWFIAKQNTNTPEPLAANNEPVVQVKTIKLQEGSIEQVLNAYGVVLPLPSKLKTINVSYSCQVEKIFVNQGQLVKPGDLLLTLKPAPSAVLQWKQAQSELNAAIQENKLLKQRLALKLATQQDFVSSQLRLKQAQVTLNNLRNQGVNKTQEIKASSAGIVALSNVQQGQIIAAGAPLLQLIDQNQWVVRLGIEPEDYALLHIDQPVFITPVNTPIARPVKGLIKIITHQIDPGTRLINIFVQPDVNQSLLMNDFVKGRIVISSVKTLRVPLQAVLPEGNHYNLFSIKQGHAVKHQVQIGLQDDHYVELLNSNLKAQDEVVVLGNYELEAGMAVSIITATNGASQ